MKPQGHQAFTLIELLVVIAMIGVLASIVILAIGPRRMFILAEDAKRRSYTRELQNAIVQYIIKEGEPPVALSSIPEGEGNAEPICREDAEDTSDCLDISALVPDYTAAIPVDSAETDEDHSGYEAYRVSNQVVISATHTGLPPGGGGGGGAGGGGEEGSSTSVPVSSEGGSTSSSCTHTYIVDDIDAQGYFGMTETDNIDDAEETEFLAADYAEISVDDSTYVEYEDLPGWTFHRFAVTIADNPEDITQIDVTWKGLGFYEFEGGAVCTHSFPGDTLLATSDGRHSFEAIYASWLRQEPLPNVYILQEGITSLGTIHEVTRHPWSGTLVEITLENTQTVRATPSHPFLLYSDYEEYQNAEDLMPGTRLMGNNGDPLTVIAVQTVDESTFVYDMTIVEHPNFLLDVGVFVHNGPSSPPTVPPATYYGHELYVKESGAWVLKDSGTAETVETLSAQYTSDFDNVVAAGTDLLEFVGYSDPSILCYSMIGNGRTIYSYYAEVTVSTCP